MSEKEGRQASNSAAFPELEVGYETRAECACPDGDEASNNDRPEWSGRIWGMHLQINVRSNLRGGHKEKGGGQDDDDTTQARHCDLEVTNTFGRAMTSEGRSCSVRSSREKKERDGWGSTGFVLQGRRACLGEAVACPGPLVTESCRQGDTDQGFVGRAGEGRSLLKDARYLCVTSTRHHAAQQAKVHEQNLVDLLDVCSNIQAVHPPSLSPVSPNGPLLSASFGTQPLLACCRGARPQGY